MASKKFLVDIDLNLNQLIKSLFEISATAPTGTKARFYFNSSDNKPYYYNGSSWVEFGATSVTGGINFIGQYNANTNTPDLEAPDTALIKKGDMYIISGAGSHYGQYLKVGDSMIAQKDDPILQTDWIYIINDTVQTQLRKYVGNFGSTNPIELEFLITHDFGTYDVIVTVYETSTNEVVECSVRIENENEVTILLNSPSTSYTQYRVVIIG